MPAAGEGPDAVDPDRVEQVVLVLGDVDLEVDGAPHDLVGRRLVHAAGVVVAAPDAGHVAARRDEDVGAAGRVEDLDPRPVQGGVLRVVADLVDPPLLDLLGVQARGRVEDGHPVAHQLAVGDHGQLHGLHALQVEHAVLVGRHQVGHADHGDLVDRLQPAEAGPVGRVADVVVGRQVRRRRRAAAGQGDACPGGTCSAATPSSSMRISLDWALTTVTTFCRPLFVRQVVEGLLDLAALLDDQLEGVLGGALRAGVGDLDGDVVALGALGEGLDPEGAHAGRGPAGRRRCRRQLGPGGGRGRPVAADPDDVARAAAVLEVAVDGVVQIGPVDEVAEDAR